LKTFCAFNVTRQSFVSLGVAIADTPLSRLRGLLGKVRMRSDEAMWVVPSHGIHTIGLRFPIDLVYLDPRQKVVHLVESLGPLRIAPFRWRSASVLQLPALSLCGSGTQLGDQLLICSPEEMEEHLASQDPQPVAEETQEAPPDDLRRAV
jgi:uncharacterized membrane protein (UPF0127 family)